MSTTNIANTKQKPADYFDDFLQWPTQWMISDDDLPIGQRLLTLFEPFIDTLIKEGRSAKTVRNHVAHLKILGAEIVRRLNEGDEDKRTLPPKPLLLAYIEEEYGPLVHQWDPNVRADEAHQRSFDATCRKLYKFISESQ